MANPLIMKLEQFTAFTDAERCRIETLTGAAHQSYDARETIIPEGKKVRHIHLVLSGLAARAKDLPDGSRQIMAFLIPGDLCDVEVFVLEAMDHDIIAVSPTVCALIPANVIEDLLSEFSRLTKALWWSTMTDTAVLRERIIDHGRREAHERLAHLFYEMLVRYRMIGLAKDDTYDFPVTQDELADATGLTTIHVNRTLKQLREDGLVEFRGQRVVIANPAKLKRAARFDANYLHLIRTDQSASEVSDRAGDLV